MGDRKSVLIDIFGEVSVRTYTTRDGREGTAVDISAFDFWGLPSFGDSQNNAQNAAQSPSQTVNSATQKQNDEDAFDDLADDDCDVPF